MTNLPKEYLLCEKAGLKVLKRPIDGPNQWDFIEAAEVERYLYTQARQGKLTSIKIEPQPSNEEIMKEVGRRMREDFKPQPAPWEFRAEDFHNPDDPRLPHKIAQDLLAEWMKEAPRIVTWGIQKTWWREKDCPYDLGIQDNAQTAMVINIQPIVKESEERALLRRARRWIGERHDMPGYSDLLAEIDELLGGS